MSYQKPVHGLDDNKALDPSLVYYDVRPVWVKAFDFMTQKSTVMTMLGMGTASCFIAPESAPFIPFISLIYFLIYIAKLNSVNTRDRVRFLPARAPMQDDLNEFSVFADKLSPRKKPSGIFCLAHEIDTGRELWMSNADVREHIWVTGTTGSGKTELLMIVMMNCLSWGSGFIMIDGKGDIATAAKVFRMLRILGRTDDFLLLNFMDSGRLGFGGGIIGHTMNPFAVYSVPEVMQTLESLLPTASGDGQQWQSRAVAMLRGVVSILIWLRDTKGLMLSIENIRASIDLDSVMRMAMPDEVCLPIYKGMPPEVKSGVLNYLKNLAGFPQELLVMPANGQQTHPMAGDPNAFVKLPDAPKTQHGYLSQLLSPPFTLLAESYRDIFGVQSGDVDMFDVVLNRRCLVSLLPGLQKTPEEMANLGKIVVSSLKTMMGDSLGSNFEGSIRRVLDARQTTSPTPFVVIMDELTYYIVKGLDMFPAQGRSLGFAFLFAVQSLTGAFEREGKVEAKSAYNTTNTKITMFVVDKETTDSTVYSGGKGLVARQTGWEANTDSLLPGDYQSDRKTSINELDRVTARDMHAQDKGEFHMTRGDQVIRAKSIYIEDDSLTNPDERDRLDHFDALRLTHFISIPPESEADIRYRRAYNVFNHILSGGEPPWAENPVPVRRDELHLFAETVDKLKSIPIQERGCVAFASIGPMLANIMSFASSGGMPGATAPEFLDPTPARQRRGRTFNQGAPRVPSRFSKEAEGITEEVSLDKDISDTTMRALEQVDKAVSAASVDKDINTTISGSDTKPKSRFGRPSAIKPVNIDDDDDHNPVPVQAPSKPKEEDNKANKTTTTSSLVEKDENEDITTIVASTKKTEEKESDGDGDSGGDGIDTVADYLSKMLGGGGGLSLDQDAGSGDDEEE